jgi:hypothetical protein
LRLRNVTVKGLRFDLKIGFTENLVDLIFSFTKNNAPSVSPAVNVDDIFHQWNDVFVLDVHGAVSNSFGCFNFSVFDEVNHFSVFIHVLGGDSLNPDGNGC